MSEPLTAAGAREALLVTYNAMAEPSEYGSQDFADALDDFAARAVDEALSVERVAEVIREAWKAKPPMDSRQLAEYIRAALVARLRGPRPEGMTNEKADALTAQADQRG